MSDEILNQELNEDLNTDFDNLLEEEGVSAADVYAENLKRKESALKDAEQFKQILEEHDGLGEKGEIIEKLYKFGWDVNCDDEGKSFWEGGLDHKKIETRFIKPLVKNFKYQDLKEIAEIGNQGYKDGKEYLAKPADEKISLIGKIGQLHYQAANAMEIIIPGIAGEKLRDLAQGLICFAYGYDYNEKDVVGMKKYGEKGLNPIENAKISLAVLRDKLSKLKITESDYEKIYAEYLHNEKSAAETEHQQKFAEEVHQEQEHKAEELLDIIESGALDEKNKK